MTRPAEVRNETALLAVLLVADVLFYIVVIPAGISDPAGFGLEEGLPPSFSARVRGFAGPDYGSAPRNHLG